MLGNNRSNTCWVTFSNAPDRFMKPLKGSQEVYRACERVGMKAWFQRESPVQCVRGRTAATSSVTSTLVHCFNSFATFSLLVLSLAVAFPLGLFAAFDE